MNSRTKARTVSGWDIGLAAAILAVVVLGWLTAPGSNGAAPHAGQLVGPAQMSARPGPGRDGTGILSVTFRPPALLQQMTRLALSYL